MARTSQEIPIVGPLSVPASLGSQRPESNSRYWQVLLLRVSCFFSIAFGILSLLSVWTGQTGGAIGVLWVSPEEAMGLIFIGFAVRMSRLEAHRPAIRIVVQTSRVCLLLLGASLVASGQAIGACYLAIGLSLLCKHRRPNYRVDAVLTALVCTFLSSCWVALLLSRAATSPVPEFLRVDFVPLAILTAIACVLSTATRAPGMLKVLAQRGPEAEAARVMFPLAFLIPLVLAILRHQAEGRHLLQPDLGLLLHVLLSAGCMAAMIIWNANRIHSAQRVRESTGVAVAEMETQYRNIFAVLRDPVWVFTPEGALEYANNAASQFSPMGSTQQSALLSAAMLGKQVKELDLKDRASGARRTLAIQYCNVLLTPAGEPGSIVLVAHVLPPKYLEPIHSLLRATAGPAEP